MNLILLEEEIHKAVFSIGNNKSSDQMDDIKFLQNLLEHYQGSTNCCSTTDFQTWNYQDNIQSYFHISSS